MFGKGYYHGSSLNLTLGHVTVDIRVKGAILAHSREPYWHIRKEPLAYWEGATHRSRARPQVEYKTGNSPQLEF
jgi:hypothetical protein